MITYTLTKESILDYLNGKLTILNQQLVTQQAELDAAVNQYKIDLDALGSYLRYELYDPEATLIADLTTIISKQMQKDNPILFYFYKWTNRPVYTLHVDNRLYLSDLSNQLISSLCSILHNELTIVEESLLDADLSYFNYSNHKSSIFDLCNNQFFTLANAAKRSRNQARNAINELRLTKCSISSITKELTIAEFSESATFELTSECKL